MANGFGDFGLVHGVVYGGKALHSSPWLNISEVAPEEWNVSSLARVHLAPDLAASFGLAISSSGRRRRCGVFLTPGTCKWAPPIPHYGLQVPISTE